MTPSDLLQDHVRRILATATRVSHELPDQALGWRPDPESNSVGWLLWHVGRVQDDHVAQVADVEQVWVTGGWARRFGLPDDTMDTGYGHDPDDVAGVQPGSSTVVVDYLTEVTEQTVALLDTITPEDLDRVVDDSWDPPVTLGVRLNSVIADNWQHVGQAGEVRGLWERS